MAEVEEMARASRPRREGRSLILDIDGLEAGGKMHARQPSEIRGVLSAVEILALPSPADCSSRE